jgi:zinc/manganese transport system substrate-binding protein
MKKTVLFLYVILLFSHSLIAEVKKVKVVASFSILGDMVANVGGDYVEIKALVGPDQDAHVYEPTPNDAKALARADIVFVNGLGFEGWLEKLIRAVEYKGRVITATKGISPRKLGKGDDPHAWQSLKNGECYVNNIASALCELDPTHAKIYQANALTYITELQKIDREIKNQLKTIPLSKRKVITSHDAFGYFGAEYGIEFLAPAGISTESEPSASAVAKLIKQVRDKNVKALFIESITDKRIIEQIKLDSGGFIGGTLYSDALSSPDKPGDTYINMIIHNLETLSISLNRDF